MGHVVVVVMTQRTLSGGQQATRQNKLFVRLASFVSFKTPVQSLKAA
jgi:hypothetical protein